MGTAISTQAGRPMSVTTPLGPDVLLLAAFTGEEALSQLFHYELELLAENRTAIAFDRLMGQRMTVELQLPRGRRYFDGLVSRFSQGHSDARFTHYRAELVPEFWLLTKRSQSRIFQHRSVPEILQEVLRGLAVTFEIRGQFQPRDYCVQYRESDFEFASRLMEEEGIYYFFQHGERGHQVVVANTPFSHPDVPEPSRVPFDPSDRGPRDEDRVTSWRKVQELRSGKYTLWDHCFELPRQHLEAEKQIIDNVTVGQVNHRLKVGENGKLEVYDYPGGYAQRFDGIDAGGGERPDDLRKIFEDNQRTVGIRMQEEATPGLVIHGEGTCRQFVAGHKFTLFRHGHGDGVYVLTQVKHTARQAGFASSDRGNAFTYENMFSGIPIALPFRPARQTPRPVIHGTQTATVVGLRGEEIFVDKYGRVKVQFHWDRQGKNDADSSCWVRVAQSWAGKTYGTFYWPRVGHEVVVAFEEGDSDRPIILGSVYNAENMPGAELPDCKDVSGVFTQSTPGGSPEEYNELTFDDEKGEELVYIRAQKDFDRDVNHNEYVWIGNDRKVTIDDDDHLWVGDKQFIEVKNGRKETIHQGGESKEILHGDYEKNVRDGNYLIRASKTAGMLGGEAAAIAAGDGTNYVAATTSGVNIHSPQRVVIKAPLVSIEADLIVLNTPLVLADSAIILCKLLSAIQGVVSPMYTPGAGNIM